MTEKNEELVRAFYKATIPGHREPLCALQAAHAVHEVPEGICTGGDRFDGVTDFKHFFHDFCAAFDVHFVAEEFITMDERVAAIGHIQGVTRRGAASIDVPFVHVWTVRDDRLDQLLFFTDTTMLTQALAQQVGWNARLEEKGDANMAIDAADRVRSSRSSRSSPTSLRRGVSGQAFLPASRGRMKVGV
jgi:ketosteroid isomerase-like protein